MKLVGGLLLIVAGIALGAYVGLWLCFIGGIVGLIHAVVAIVHGLGVNAFAIAFDIVKILFAGFIRYVSAAILVIPGVALLSKHY